MFYERLETFPEDPIFGLYTKFLQDPRKDKINLGIGIYFNENLEKKALLSVEKAKEKDASKAFVATYLPIEGDPLFIEEMEKLLLGKLYPSVKEKIFSAQTIGATGALSLSASFLQKQGFSSIFISDPTWPNHKNIFSSEGITPSLYPYFDRKKQEVSFEKLLLFLEKVPNGSLFLFHGVCHNPSGMDFSEEQTEKLLEKIEKKAIFPIVDLAYHGLGLGVEEDLQFIRALFERDIPSIVAYSCSKNFGLYRERTGLFLAYCKSKKIQERLRSQILFYIRSTYSNPPSYGARLAGEVLQDPSLKTKWQEDLSSMRKRIEKARSLFSKGLQKEGIDVSFVERQKGLFSLLSLEESQVSQLIEKYAIYLPKSGRINFCGISQNNIEYLVEAFKKVML